jgi:NADH:ubiquinone oxidoreductase subunit E
VTSPDLEQLDLAPLDEIIARETQTVSGRAALIPVLQQAQARYGYLPEPALERIAKRLALPISTVYGVVTFYAQFHMTPRGRHTIRSCQGTACHVKGGKPVLEALSRALGVKSGETTPDLRFTLETVACLGCCFLAPSMMIDDQYFGKLAPRDIEAVLEQFA